MSDEIPEEQETQAKEEPKDFSPEHEGRKKKIPWKPAAGFAAVAILFFAVGFLVRGPAQTTGMAIQGAADKNTVANDVMGIITESAKLQGGTGNVTVVSVTEESGLYKITLSIDGQNAPFYATEDGKILIDSRGVYKISDIKEQQAASASQQQPQAAAVPKTDKPKAELYIFSYCPAGTAALDSFAEMGKILKNVADVRVKFFSNMHGEHERQQNMIQECIQDVAKDKYFDYASQYSEKVYNVCSDVNCDKNESIKLMESVGIDSDAVMNCVNQTGEQLYIKDQQDASALRLQYSPSVVINGLYLQNADRTPQGLKNIVCSAFNTPPSECNETLSATGSTASGNCG